MSEHYTVATDSDKTGANQLGNHRPNPIVVKLADLLLLNVVRRHPDTQIRKIKDNLARFGQILPILIDAHNRIIDGTAVVEALRQAGETQVWALRIDWLTEHDVHVLRLALNRISEDAEWDKQALRAEFRFLETLDIDLETTGFEIPEIDLILLDDESDPSSATSCTDQDVAPDRSGPPVTQPGDIWALDDHRLLCADMRDAALVGHLIAPGAAAMVITDPPYNVPIQGHVGGKGAIRHREFAMASGEMTARAFAAFLAESTAVLAYAAATEAVIYVFMDWRHFGVLEQALAEQDLALINLCVWAKTSPGMGSLYRSQHELVAVARRPGARHRNNVMLGVYGRNRSNLWSYPGANALGSEAREALVDHPTPKPVAMIADAILDVTRRGDLVFDPFLGGGATLIACERTGRTCRGVEIDPHYVDAAIRRWQAETGKRAVNAETGVRFDDCERVRVGDEPHQSANGTGHADPATDRRSPRRCRPVTSPESREQPDADRRKAGSPHKKRTPR